MHHPECTRSKKKCTSPSPPPPPPPLLLYFAFTLAALELKSGARKIPQSYLNYLCTLTSHLARTTLDLGWSCFAMPTSHLLSHRDRSLHTFPDDGASIAHGSKPAQLMPAQPSVMSETSPSCRSIVHGCAACGAVCINPWSWPFP